MPFTFLFDVVVVGLLITGIFFAVRLNRKLSLIYDNRSELRSMLEQLSVSLSQAEKGITELHGAANSLKNDLETPVIKALTLKDDITFLIERGENLAHQLENHTRKGRTISKNSSRALCDDAELSTLPESPPSLESDEVRLARMLEGLR